MEPTPGTPTSTHHDHDNPSQQMRDAARKLETLENNSHDLWSVAAQFESAVNCLPNYDHHLQDAPNALARTYDRDQLVAAARRMRSIASTAAFEARQYGHALHNRADVRERDTLIA